MVTRGPSLRTASTVFVGSSSAVAMIAWLMHVAACSSFESTEDVDGGADASGRDGSGVDGTFAEDDADASPCPPLQPFCDGGVAVECPGLPARCFAFCPQGSIHEVASGTCAAWGGCLAGITTPMHVACLRNVADSRNAGIYVDLVQDAAAKTRAEGWRATCAGTSQPAAIPWAANEPNDANDAGTETKQEQCAEILAFGSLVDTGCFGKFEFVCERPR